MRLLTNVCSNLKQSSTKYVSFFNCQVDTAVLRAPSHLSSTCRRSSAGPVPPLSNFRASAAQRMASTNHVALSHKLWVGQLTTELCDGSFLSCFRGTYMNVCAHLRAVSNFRLLALSFLQMRRCFRGYRDLMGTTVLSCA